MTPGFLLAAAFYGLTFNPAQTNAPTAARIYPVSPVAYQMVQPDGTKRAFELVDEKEGVLSGPKPWLGVVKGRCVDVWADPKYTGGKLRTAFTFVDGRLRLMVLDGNKFTFAKGVSSGGGLAELFSERQKRSYEKGSAADIWNDADNKRLRLWFANPNSAGTLMALLSLTLLWGVFRGGKWTRIVAGASFAASLYALFATGSRGALVGFVAGVLVMAAPRAKSVLTKRGLLVLLSGAFLLCAAAAATGNARRIADTFHRIDGGNATRLKIGKAAVEMFSDAPFGWRGGEVPGRNACLNWYVFDEPHSLRTHVMSLAECGWFAGFFYFAFWMLALTAGAFCAKRGNPLVAALWAAFGASGCFNPVYVDWETWALPVAALGFLSVPRHRLSAKEWRTCAAVAACASLFGIAALALAGKALDRPTKTPVKPCGKATFVNGANPRVWIVGDPLVMAGNGFPGREILAHYARRPQDEAVSYVYAVEDLPAKAECVVVAGRNVPDYLAAHAEGRACEAKRLMLLSPSVGPDSVSAKLAAECDLIWLAGSLLAVRDASYGVKRAWVKQIPGCERYVPNWLGFALAFARSQNLANTNN